MTIYSEDEPGRRIDEIVVSAFDALGMERSQSSTATHLYAKAPIREPESSELLVEPTERGLGMDLILGPLAGIDPGQIRRLCADWSVRRYPIKSEAIYLPGGLHVRATALYLWPRRSHRADADLRAITVRIEDFVRDISRLARALVRLRPLDLAAAAPGLSGFVPAIPSPLHQHDAAIRCVTWTESGVLWAGASDGTLISFAPSSADELAFASRSSEHGEVIALAHDSVNGRLAIATSRGLIVIEPDSTRVQVHAGAYVTDVDWDPATGDLIAALDYGRSSPGAIEGFLPIWDSRPVAIWPPDMIRENAAPAASADPDDYGAQCVASTGRGTLAVGTTMWESGRVELFSTSDLGAGLRNIGGRFLSNWGSVDKLAWHSEQGLAVDDNGSVVVWRDPTDMRQPRDEDAYLGRRGLSSLAWAPSGLLAVGTYDGYIVIWGPGEVGNDEPPSYEAHLESAITALAWSPAGELAVATTHGNLSLVRSTS